MNRYIVFIAFSLISTQLAAIVDCKMFMPQKDRVVVLEKRSCQLVADNSIKNIGDIDVCLAKMKTANGINIVRVVLEGQREDRFNHKLLIVEKDIKDITSEEDRLLFAQDYFNTANLKRTHYDVQLSANLSSMHLKVAEGRFGLDPLYDVSFECR